MSQNLELRTTQEQLFAVCATLMACLVAAVFLSVITNTMRELKEVRSQQIRTQRLIREYVTKHGISSKLTARVKKYIEIEHEVKLRNEGEQELMKTLPTNLLMDLHQEAWSPHLTRHALFATVHARHPRTEHVLCFRALRELPSYEGETIFTTGDVCSWMLFAIEGEFKYTVGRTGDPQDTVAEHVVCPGKWLCEAVLWTPWEHRGELVALESSVLCTIGAEECANVFKDHEAALVDAVIYAKCFIAELNSRECEFTDLPHVHRRTSLRKPDGDTSQGMSTTLTALRRRFSFMPDRTGSGLSLRSDEGVKPSNNGDGATRFARPFDSS